VFKFLAATLALSAALCAQETRPDSRPKDGGSVIPPDSELVVRPSGLKYKILVQGPEGAKPKRGDHVVCNYKGMLTDGSEFDASRGAPAEFRIGQLIEGWNEGLQLMTPGTKALFVVPSELGYGRQGSPPKIPPDATLVFEVELVSFKEGEPLPEPPRYRKLDPAKTQATDAGVKYEIVQEGKGDPIGTSPFDLHFSFWGPTGALIQTTTASGKPARITADKLNLAFLKEVLPLMRAGEKRLCEVPPALAFGSKAVSPDVPADSVTTWLLEVVRVVQALPVPQFVPREQMKLSKTPSGLEYEVVREGAGRAPLPSDVVTVHYAGWLVDGKPFDASYTRGEPTSFPLRNVIRGWSEGLQLVKEGGAIRLVVPPELGYGQHGQGDVIPPNAVLVFYVELEKIGA